MPHVSIVMPAFNVAPYIGRAIESILAQPYRDRELIVVNDGSTDDIARALGPYRADIVYLDQPHTGVSAARNNGIRDSSGDVVMILDADDALYPDVLGPRIAWMDSHPEYDVLSLHGRETAFRTEDQAKWIVQYNFLRYCALVRREVYDRHGLHDEQLKAHVDWDVWMRLIAAGIRVTVSYERTIYHRVREGSVSYDIEEKFSNEVALFERVLEKGVDLPGLVSRLQIARGRQAMARKDYRAARRFLRAGLRDREMPLRRRLRFAPAALAPALVWPSYRWLASARRNVRKRRQDRRARDRGVRV